MAGASEVAALAAEAEEVASKARGDADAALRALAAGRAMAAAVGDRDGGSASRTVAAMEAAAGDAERGALEAEAAAASLRHLASRACPAAEAMPLAASPPLHRRPLRLLCLHGYHDSAANLGRKTRRLAKSLEKAGLAELVAVDGPFVLTGTWTCELKGTVHAYERRAWMTGSAEPPHARVPWEEQTQGLARAVGAFAEAWNSLGPFDGVLGYSQGASLAAALVAIYEGRSPKHLPRPELKTPIRFAVLCAGFWPPAADAGGLCAQDLGQSLRTPSLHILGDADGQVPPRQRGDALAACFRDARVHRHDGGHYFRCDAAAVDAVHAFLRDCM